MSEKDWADKIAEEKLPCSDHCSGGVHIVSHGVICPAYFRGVIAQALRAAWDRGVLDCIRDEHKALVDTPMKMTFYPPSDQTVDQLVEVQKAIK